MHVETKEHTVGVSAMTVIAGLKLRKTKIPVKA